MTSATMPSAAAPGQPDSITDESVVMIGRQSILNERREVFGYELFDRTIAAHAHTAATDAAMLLNALSYTGSEVLVGRKLVFINCTRESLAGGHLELIHPDKVVLEVPALDEDASPAEIAATVPLLESLCQRGFRLALNQQMLRSSYASWLPLASFIKLDMLSIPLENAAALVRHVNQHTQASIIAEKVETQQQYEHMLAQGVRLFQGFWFARPDVVQAKTVRPSQAIILQLLNLIRRESSPADIEALLKKDPALSFSLLRFINSSGFGLSCEITSFRHAVMILGLKKLFRWAALLLTTSRASGYTPAVGQIAVVRGRLMELLAAEMLSPEEAENAFVVGIFSMLDAMLNLPMEQALATIALPQPVVDALLHRRGVYAPFLELALACEHGDDAAFARNAEALHLSSHQINWAHLQALVWADSLNEGN